LPPGKRGEFLGNTTREVWVKRGKTRPGKKQESGSAKDLGRGKTKRRWENCDSGPRFDGGKRSRAGQVTTAMGRDESKTFEAG